MKQREHSVKIKSPHRENNHTVNNVKGFMHAVCNVKDFMPVKIAQFSVISHPDLLLPLAMGYKFSFTNKKNNVKNSIRFPDILPKHA